MTSNREKAAATIAGAFITHEGDGLRSFGEHAARELEDEGLLADDLPAPSFYAHGNQDKPMWDTGNYFRADALEAPKVALSKAGNVWKMNPGEARSIALALLAASAHAQKEEANE